MCQEGDSIGTDICSALGELQIVLFKFAQESSDALNIERRGAVEHDRIVLVQVHAN